MRILRIVVAALALVAVETSNGAADMLEQGQTFPSWKLQDHTGATVSSSDLTGKTYLLWFFPKAIARRRSFER